jgi:hypothetical protein
MMRLAHVAAVAAASLSFAPAMAAQGAYYQATLATAPAKSAVVTRDTLWRCAGTTCTAPRSGTRDAILCELVAQSAGQLTGFTVAGAAYDADRLAKCNAKAK